MTMQRLININLRHFHLLLIRRSRRIDLISFWNDDWIENIVCYDFSFFLLRFDSGNNGMRSNRDLYPEDLQQIYPIRKLSLPTTPSATNESNDFYSIIEIMRSKWLSSDEGMRLDYLDRFKQSCEKYLQFIRNQHLSFGHESQFHQTLHSFLTSILDVLNYMTSSNLDLSLRIKLVLATCLGWLIKHAQVIYCKKNYRTICTVFKNILFHGASNNRQLAVRTFVNKHFEAKRLNLFEPWPLNFVFFVV